MMYQDVLDHLPYRSSFRFVDRILLLDEQQVKGEYTTRKDAFFYADHFPGNPVTPGVIITEIMAQIGVVVLGVYLILHLPEFSDSRQQGLFPVLTSTDISFHRMVLPETTLTVVSERQYFRFGKLKCFVEAFDDKNELIARGTFAGVIGKIRKQ